MQLACNLQRPNLMNPAAASAPSLRTLDVPAASWMLVLCLIWSMQQVALKASAPDFAPLLQLALRAGIATVLLLAYMRFKGERLTVAHGVWQPGVLLGTLFAVEFLLLGQALRFTSAGHVVVFLYAAPIFAALGLHWRLPAERLSAVQWCGIGLAFTGIALAFLGQGLEGAQNGWQMLLGDAFALGSAAMWGMSTVTIRLSRLSQLPATQTLLYQLLVAFCVLLPAAWLMGQNHFSPTPLALASLLYQGVAVCFFSFLMWFVLLRRYLASQLGVFAFLTPILGVVLSAWLLHEPLEPGFAAGALLVLLGILLVTGHKVLISGWHHWVQRQRTH